MKRILGYCLAMALISGAPAQEPITGAAPDGAQSAPPPLIAPPAPLIPPSTSAPPEIVTPTPPETPLIPATPAIPSVDPELRKLYLGKQGGKLGSPKGPRDLATAKARRPKQPWHGELELGASGYRGNTDSDLAMLGLQVERKAEGSEMKLAGRGNYGNSDGERSQENANVRASYRHDLEYRYYYSTEARYFYDALADLDYQVMGLLSLGHDLVKRDNAVLALELGPAYIVEKKGGERKDFVAARLAQSIEYMFNERVLFWQRAEYLPAMNDPGVYLVLAEVGLESVLSSWLRFRTTVQYRYDSEPAADKDKVDSFLAASLVAVY